MRMWLNHKGVAIFYFRYYIAYCVPMTESKGVPGKIIFPGACLIAAVWLARGDAETRRGAKS
jgi:hypothetical protein